MKTILNFIMSFFKEERKVRRQRTTPRHYISQAPSIWNTFKVFVLFFSLSASASTVNWDITYTGDVNDRAVYGFIGDTAFRTQVIGSIQDKTFSSFIGSNPTSVLGNYVIPKATGYVKSIDFTIDNHVNKMSMFVVVFNNTNPNTYSFADISDILSQKRSKSKVNTFSFNFDNTPPTRIDPVPEANVVCLLVVGTCLILMIRPRHTEKKKAF